MNLKSMRDIRKEEQYIRCPQNCGFVAHIDHLNEHFNKECPNWNVECPQCGLLMKRNTLAQHGLYMCAKKNAYNYEAPQVAPQVIHQVIECEYAKFGCNVKVSANLMPNHIKEDSHHHLDLFMNHVAKFQPNLLTNQPLQAQPLPLYPPTQSMFPLLPTAPPMDNERPAHPRLALENISFGETMANIERTVNFAISFVRANINMANLSHLEHSIRSTGLLSTSPIIKFCLFFAIYFMFSGTIKFLFNCWLLYFVISACHQSISTYSLYANPTTKPLALLFLGILSIYLTTIIL